MLCYLWYGLTINCLHCLSILRATQSSRRGLFSSNLWHCFTIRTSLKSSKLRYTWPCAVYLSQFKGLCHSCLVHLSKITAFSQQNISSKHYFKRYKQQLTFRVTSFQKPQLKSVSVFFKSVHPSLVLYLLCNLHILLNFWAVILMFHSIWCQYPLSNFDK